MLKTTLHKQSIFVSETYTQKILCDANIFFKKML